MTQNIFLKKMVLKGNLSLIHKSFLKLLCKRAAQQQSRVIQGTWCGGREGR